VLCVGRWFIKTKASTVKNFGMVNDLLPKIILWERLSRELNAYSRVYTDIRGCTCNCPEIHKFNYENEANIANLVSPFIFCAICLRTIYQ